MNANNNETGHTQQIKLDFTKMPRKVMTTPFVVSKTTEEKLADAQREIEALKAELKQVKENAMFVAAQKHHQNLWQSGLSELAEHFERDAECFDETWMKIYNKGGLEGLQVHLRHYMYDDCPNGGYFMPCSECKRIIDMLHD